MTSRRGPDWGPVDGPSLDGSRSVDEATVIDAPSSLLVATVDGGRVGHARPAVTHRVLTGLAVVAVVAVATLVAGPADGPGRLGGPSPPVEDGTDVARTVTTVVPVGGIPTSPVAVPVDEGAVALRGGPIVDAEDGRTLADARVGPATRGRVASRIEGDHLVHEDLLSGVILSRYDLAIAPDPRPTLLGWGGRGIVAAAGDDLVGLGADGTEQWRAAGAADDGLTIVPGANWAVGTTVDGTAVVVRDLRDGRVAWTMPTEGQPPPASSARLVTPADGPPLVVLVDGDEVVGHAPADGSELWRSRPAQPQDPAAPSELRLADAHDVLVVLAARMSEGSSRVLRLDPTTGRVRTRVLGPVPTSPLDRLDGRWAVDARGAAVVGAHGVTTTLWRRDPNLVVVEDVVEVGLADDALVLVRAGLSPVVEVLDRGDHEELASFTIVLE